MAAFVQDLTHPNSEFNNRDFRPLLEQNPVAFWRYVSLVQFIINIILFYKNAWLRVLNFRPFLIPVQHSQNF